MPAAAVAGIAEAVVRRDLGQAIEESDTTKAIRYAQGCWGALMRFCDDGHLEIDKMQRNVRSHCRFRSEKLFICGSDTGGERAAAIYGLIGQQTQPA